jgi:hypothetical protein
MDKFVAQFVLPDHSVDPTAKIYISNQWCAKTAFHTRCRSEFKKLHPNVEYNGITRLMNAYYDQMSEQQKAFFKYHAKVFRQLGSGYHSSAAIAAAVKPKRQFRAARVGWSWITLDDGASVYMHDDGVVMRNKLTASDASYGKTGPTSAFQRYVIAHLPGCTPEASASAWSGMSEAERLAFRPTPTASTSAEF